MTNKEPWLAVNLSNLLPGIGQVYAGKWLKGLLFVVGYFGLLGVGGAILVAGGHLWVSILLLGIGSILIAIGSLVDAYRSTRKNNSEEFERTRKSQKDPWLAIFLTSIWLGLGHFYIRRPVQGVLLFILGLVATAFPVMILPLLIVTPLIFLNLYRAVQREQDNINRGNLIVLMIVLGCFAPLLSVISSFTIRKYGLEARFIPAGSMEPSLQVNDRIIVNKVSYRWSDSPKRGDIVVFNPPDAIADRFSQAFVKRIIGLPGETVEIQNGKVVIDGDLLEEPYIAEGNLTQTEPCNFSGFEQAFLRQPQTIPEKQYLALGDNRENSLDGRCWGLVPRANIIGKASHRFWPLNRSGSLTNPFAQ